jgi:hypothetical protein
VTASPLPGLPSLEIPAIAELGEWDQWVLWGEKKVPLTPDGRPASSTDPRTWSSFQEAAEAFVRGVGYGLGFVFTEDDPYFGVDLDHCIDEDGRPTEEAAEIVRALDTYTERSPSGMGLHILGRGKLPPGWRGGNGVEMYDQRRYFTVSGALWPDGPEALADRTEELGRLRVKLSRKRERGGTQNEARKFLPDERHPALVRRARALRKHGLTAAELEGALLAYNAERCDPPKDEEEVRRIAQWAAPLEAETREPILVNMAEVAPEEVHFLVKPYIPKRKLTEIQGDPGLGKTWVMLAIAAAISKGLPLPGEDGKPSQVRPPASVLYMTAEDGLGDTLRPRLDAMGADVSRVTVLDGLRRESGERAEVTLADLDVLEAALAEVKPALVVVDPIQGYLGAGVDMHRANEVRPLLAGLARLADRFGPAVTAIRHLRKSGSDRAIHRGLGSIDFAAAVRSILVVGEDPETPGRRVLAHMKSNLTPLGPSLGFEIQDGGFYWTGASELSADDLLAAREPEQSRAPREEAEDVLRAILSESPLPADEVYRQAEAAGVSRSTLRRAKSRLGIRAKREGFGPGGKWLWELPG